MKIQHISVLALLLMIFCTGCGFGEQRVSVATGPNAEKVYYITPTTGAPGTITTSLDVCGEEGILVLVSSYYSALAHKDVSLVNPLVSDSTKVSDTLFEHFSDVSKVDVKKVYYIDGLAPVDKLVYVYYDIYIDGYSTPVPSLDELYINNNNGLYQIYNGPVKSSVYEQIKTWSGTEGVKELINSVNLAFKKTLTENPDIEKYLNGSPDSTGEDENNWDDEENWDDDNWDDDWDDNDWDDEEEY